MDQQKCLYLLLTNGSCPIDLARGMPDTASLNKLLRSMGFESIYWPSPPQLILKNLSAESTLLPPWTEATALESKQAIIQAASGSKIKGGIASTLEKHGWISRLPNGRVELTPRALVQFEEFISDLNSNYTPCTLCKLLCQGGVLMDKRRGDGCTIYTFEMESLNRAIEWLKDAHVFVEYASRGGNCDELEQEMDDFMACYEEKERNSKKRLVVDSEGFKFYR